MSPLQPSPPDGSPVSGLSASPVRRRGSHGLSDWRVGWRKIEVLAEADAGEGRHDMLGGWRGVDGYGGEEGKDLVGKLDGMKARLGLGLVLGLGLGLVLGLGLGLGLG